MSTIIRWQSGLLREIDAATDCSTVVVPASGRRQHEPALALADRRHEVDHPADQVARVGLEPEPVVGVHRGEGVEVDPLARRLRVRPVDAVDAHHRVELLLALALAGLAHLADDGVAAAQAELPHHRQGEVHVVRPGQVARGADEGVVVEHVEDARRRDEHVVLEHRGVGLVAVARAVDGPLAVPATTATVAAAAALAVVVEVLLVLGAVLALVPPGPGSAGPGWLLVCWPLLALLVAGPGLLAVLTVLAVLPVLPVLAILPVLTALALLVLALLVLALLVLALSWPFWFWPLERWSSWPASSCWRAWLRVRWRDERVSP